MRVHAPDWLTSRIILALEEEEQEVKGGSTINLGGNVYARINEIKAISVDARPYPYMEVTADLTVSAFNADESTGGNDVLVCEISGTLDALFICSHMRTWVEYSLFSAEENQDWTPFSNAWNGLTCP